MNMGQLSSLRPQLGHVHVRHLRHWPGLILGLSLQKQAICYTTYCNCSDLWGSTGYQASHRGAAKHGICFVSRLVPSNVNSYHVLGSVDI